MTLTNGLTLTVPFTTCDLKRKKTLIVQSAQSAELDECQF